MLLTTSEVAARLNLTVGRVRQLIRGGVFHGIHTGFGPGRGWRFDPDSVEQYAESQRRPRGHPTHEVAQWLRDAERYMEPDVLRQDLASMLADEHGKTRKQRYDERKARGWSNWCARRNHAQCPGRIGAGLGRRLSRKRCRCPHHAQPA